MPAVSMTKAYDDWFANSSNNCAVNLLKAPNLKQWTRGSQGGADPENTQGTVDIKTHNTWPLITEVWDPLTNNHWPPRNVQLSDELVFFVLKLHPANSRKRSELWNADFDSAGNIRQARVPKGPAPVVVHEGKRFAVVYGTYYALVGDEGAPYHGWIISDSKDSPGSKDLTFGNFILPEAFKEEAAFFLSSAEPAASNTLTLETCAQLTVTYKAPKLAYKLIDSLDQGK